MLLLCELIVFGAKEQYNKKLSLNKTISVVANPPYLKIHLTSLTYVTKAIKKIKVFEPFTISIENPNFDKFNFLMNLISVNLKAGFNLIQ